MPPTDPEQNKRPHGSTQANGTCVVLEVLNAENNTSENMEDVSVCSSVSSVFKCVPYPINYLPKRLATAYFKCHR